MKTSLKIQNLKCGGCAHTIKTKLNTIDKIEVLDINTETNEVSFNYTDEHQILEVTTVLSKLGYPTEGASNSISKKAKSFVSCAVGRMNS